jgi:CRP-like cAMP-binding protein
MDAAFSNMLNEKIKDYSQYNKMKTLQPFALLEPGKMLVLVDKLVEKKYSAGENIIIQGEAGDAYYIVKSGLVAVFKKKGDEEPVQVATLSDGEGFGEEALIREEPRNATVQAIDDTIVLKLDKKDFDDILKKSYLDWDFPEDVEENRDKYYIIDARVPPEYEEEHIEGAVNIPIEILRQKYSELDPSREYLTYCTNDSRGMTAAFLMRSQGFKVKTIRGGLSAWDGPMTGRKVGIHLPGSSF